MALRYEIFQALGDPTRLEIVERLGSQGPQSTGALTADLGMTRQAAAKHLHLLERAGIVESVPEGRQILRRLNPEVLEDTAEFLRQRGAAWDRALDRLKSFLEE